MAINTLFETKENIMPTVKLDPRGEVRVQFPAAMSRRLKLRKGGKIEVIFLDDFVVLAPAGRLPKDQRYFWTAEWQAKEREADADIAAGRVKSFSSVNDMIRDLRGDV